MTAMTTLGLLACLTLAQSATYFPVDEKRGVSSFEEEWYGKALKALDEKPLHTDADATKGTVYRLTILPTWGNPVTVRLTVLEGKATIEGKRLDGQGGYEPGKLVEKGLTPVSAETLATFEKLFAKVNFEKQTTRDPTRGLDGSQYILERVTEGKYHVVVRWSPDSDPQKRGLSAFLAASQSLYRASPLKKDVTNKGRVELRKSE
ncbi:MAG: hypothetical protein ABTQ32_08775 [Myxococcaceae bacterium]